LKNEKPNPYPASYSVIKMYFIIHPLWLLLQFWARCPKST